MWETVLFPVAIGVAVVAAIVARRGASKQRARLAVLFAAGLLDLWLWLAATVGPIGPQVSLFLILLIAHVALALQAIRDVSGFRLRGGRGSVPGLGRYHRISGRGGGYRGYRGD